MGKTFVRIYTLTGSRRTLIRTLPLADDSELLIVSPSEVCNALLGLNPRKAEGPDGINNWLLRDYADFLTSPVCDILNASFAEQRLPRSWKDADVTPLIKVKPVTTIAKHIRPISLTPALSKLAEDFVVSNILVPQSWRRLILTNLELSPIPRPYMPSFQ